MPQFLRDLTKRRCDLCPALAHGLSLASAKTCESLSHAGSSAQPRSPTDLAFARIWTWLARSARCPQAA
eukprot:gene8378-4911_t